MNGKNCQLCGKPLGRMRSAGDFCSREHRNQYRLRRSMECLTEANAVSTLARRRENPKPLPTPAAASAAECEPRAIVRAAQFGDAGSRQPDARLAPARASARVGLASAGHVSSQRAMKAAPAMRRVAGMQLPAERAFTPKLPSRRVGVVPGLAPAKRYRKTWPAAKMGNAWRVSARGPFRLPKLRLKASGVRLRSEAALRAGGSRKIRLRPSARATDRRSGVASWRGLSRTPVRREKPETAPPHVRLENRPAKPLRINPAVQNAERRSAVAVARRSTSVPTTSSDIAPASLPSLRVARLQALRPEACGVRPGARLSFRETKFTGAPDEPTSFEWIPASSLEHKER